MVIIFSSLFQNFIKENKIKFVLLVVNIIFLSLIKVPLPYFSKIIIDNILSIKQYELIFPTIAIFFTIMCVQIIFGKLNANQNAIFFQSFIFDIRSKIFKKSMQNYSADNEKIGLVQTLIVSDIENLANNYMTVISTFFSSIILVISYITIMCLLNLRLATICMIFVPFYIVWTIYVSKKLKEYSLVAQQRKGSLISILTHFLTSLVPIHIYSYFQNVDEEFDSINNENQIINKKIIITQSFFNIISGTVIAIASFLPFFIGIYYVIENRLTIGELIAFNSYATSMFTPLTTLINLYTLTKSSEVYENRISNLISPLSKTDNNKIETEISKLNTSNRNELLRIVNYSLYNNNGNLLIEDSNLSVSKKDIIKLEGDNGVGKTLFLKSIVGLYENYSGSIIFENYSVSKNEVSNISRDIVYVDNSQKFVLENFNDELNALGSDKEEIINFIFNLINHDSFSSLETERENLQRDILNYNLSTGQAQLLRIMRALLKQPKILILDEIFSNIGQAKVDLMIKNIIRIYPDIAIIIVDHHMDSTQLINKSIEIKENKLYCKHQD